MRMQMTGRRLASIMTPVALFSFLFTATDGLASDQQILGRVTDTEGAVVADAMVLLTPVNHADGRLSGPPRTLRSDQEGAFYASLPAGRYRVAAVKSGFDVAMTDLHSRPRGVLTLEMTRSPRLSRRRGAPDGTGADLGGWILRQQKDNVLRALQPVPADGVMHTPAVRAETPGAGPQGWAATLFDPLDGHFVQQLSGGGSTSEDAGATLGRTTGLSLAGDLNEDTRWRFDGWSGSVLDEVNGAGSRLQDRNNRGALGFDYRSEGRDSVSSDLQYGVRRYGVEPGTGSAQGTEQAQRTLAVRSRWERRVEADTSLYLEGEYFRTGARQPERTVADGRIDESYWSAATGVALLAGDHSIELGLATQQFDYGLWDRGVVLYGNDAVPGPGIDAGGGPAFSLKAADSWRTGALTEVSYGVGYHNQPGVGTSYIVPRAGVTLTPPGSSGVVMHSEVLYRVDGDRSPVEQGDRLGYLVGIERRPTGAGDRLQVAASYSFRPFADRWPAGGLSGRGLSPRDAPLVLGDGSMSHHEVEVEVAHAYGMFRGGVAGRVGLAEGRLSPAMNEAPVQVLRDGEARYYQTGLWAACVQTDTEVQLDYGRVLSEETLAAPGIEPSDYRRLNLVVYQQIPGPRVLGEARLRVLMAYQGFDYDSLYDGPDGETVSGRASRLTGGLDISF